uniref:URB1 ribosome biogenesis homolog n=1 Tax=Petromyzon marinus TaxID=7757 RepID=S4RZR1_PETMA
DIRMAYVRFTLSFLISGDANTVRQVLELKDFLIDVFRAGLKEDRVSTVNLLLCTLRQKVVENPGVSKTQKVRFFTAAILNQIAGVFKWDGVDDVSDETTTTDGSEAGRALVCDLAYDFLLHLCCSVKTGIAFRDPSLGTSSRSGNLTLLQLLLDLRSSVCEEPWAGRLAVELLRACPDLLGRYLQQTDISFVPRARSAWLRNVRFLRQVYEAQPLVSPLFDLPERLALPRAVAVVMVTTTPPVATRAMLTQGLNVPHSVVRHTTLSLISLMLTRMLGSMERCGAGGVGDACDAGGGTAGGGGGPYSPRELQELRTAMSEAIGKVLPDVTSLISAWNQISGPAKASEAVPAQEPACEKDEGKARLCGCAELGEVQEMLLKAELLHVLRLYQQVAPHLLAQSSFDFSKLLVGAWSDLAWRGVTSEGTPPILQYRTLQLMLALPVSRYAWFKCRELVEGAADGTLDGSDKSTFYLLLRMFVCSDHPQLQSATQQLLVKILRDSGVFDFTWRELDIWLKGLLDFSREQQEPILTFFTPRLLYVQVVCKVLASPYVYLDKVSEFVQEAATLRNLDSHTPNADIMIVSSPRCSDVDAGLLTELGGEGVEQPLPQDAIAASFPYSALVPCSLQLLLPLLPLQNNFCAGAVCRYLARTLKEVLHSQTEPLTLVLALQALQRPLSDARSEGDGRLPRAALSAVAEFHRYYAPFVPASVREELVWPRNRACAKNISLAVFPHLLRLLLLVRVVDLSHSLKCQFHIDALLRAAAHIPASRLTSATRHTLLYLQHVTQRFLEYDQDTGPQVIAAYGQLLLGIISRAEVLERASKADRTSEQKSEQDLLVEDVFSTLNLQKDLDNSEILRDVVATVLKHPTLHDLFAVGSGSLARGTGSACPAEHLTNAVVSLMCTLLDTPAVGEHVELCGPFLRRLVAGAAAVVSSSAASSSVAAAAVLANLRRLRHLLPTSDVNNLVELLLRLPAHSLLIGGDDNNDADAVGDRAERTPDGGRDATEGRGATGKKGKQRRRQSLKSGGTDSAAVGLTVFGETLAALLERLGTEDLSVLHAAHVRLVLALAVRSRRSRLLVRVRQTEAVHLAAGLVARSRSHRAAFELWALRGGGVEALRQHPASLWELLEAYLTHVELADPCRPVHVCDVAAPFFLSEVYSALQRYMCSIVHYKNVILYSEMCPRCGELEAPRSVRWTRAFLPAWLHACRWEVVDVLLPGPFRGVEDRVAEACVRCLITTFSAKQERDKCFETHVLNRLQKLLASDVELPAKLWNTFMKTALKHRYDDPVTLATVTKVIESCSTVLAPGVLHTMVTGHSLFLPILLSGEQLARGALVKLLFTLVQKCPNICDIHHFALLLGAYTATLSETDQCLLLLMRIYENNNLSLLDFSVRRLLMWGPEAVSLHATRRTLGRSLWQLPSPDRILGLLDAGRMYETAVNFPLHRTLLPDNNYLFLIREPPSFTGGSHLYDPAFLLPLFSAILVPECAVDCRRFVEVHGLGLVFAGLASLHPALRGACYHVLALFHSQLEGSHFPEKPQTINFVDISRTLIKQHTGTTPEPLPLFLTGKSLSSLNPEHHMYSRINIFLLSHQYLDSKKIPAFYKFFFSQDVEVGKRTRPPGSLGLLAKGLRDRASLMVCAQQRVLSILMAHHTSPLSSLATQEHVVRVLSRAAAVPRAASSLVHEGGLLAWLAVLVSRPRGSAVSSRALGSLVELLHRLWLSVGAAAEEEQQGGGSETGGRSGAGKTKHAISLEIIDEFLHVLLTLLQHNRYSWRGGTVFNNYYGICEARVKAWSTRRLTRRKSRFTHDPSPLTSHDIQLLLFAWARVSSSAKLPHHLPTFAFEQAAAR